MAALHGVTRVVLVEDARRGAPAAGLLRDCRCSGEGRGDPEAERREERWGCRSGDWRWSPRGLEKTLRPLRHNTRGPGCSCYRVAASWLPRQAGLARLGTHQIERQ
ncbi:hypothetical protein NDU88_004150 [Pleurodeles waltl]|uniref:Uncharacterized protein n=1 Tax=Pleurodeles waltl TaxID=8319 RepID=A0AAV7TQH7_PLEWA|nr:hypothetical protein NDU88_004150 [Pleurodeles waltl]